LHAPIELSWWRFDALSPASLYEILAFRQAILVVEQRSPYADLDGADLDRADQQAWHLLARAGANRELLGYARIRVPADPAAEGSFGRVTVAPDARRGGLGRRLALAAIGKLRDGAPYRPIAIGAQAYLARFYESLGFVATGGVYDDCGVPHIDMRLPPPRFAIGERGGGTAPGCPGR
jgi:ElaA protein